MVQWLENTRLMAGNAFSEKSSARRELEHRRRAMDPEQVGRLGGEVQRHLAAHPGFQAAQTVALYLPQSFEVPTAALRQALAHRGARAVFPRFEKDVRTLTFHVVGPGDALEAAAFGLQQPRAHAPQVALTDIDLFVVPGVGFTRQGARLGRGKGYYDASLAKARGDAIRVGIAFECQVVDALPEEPWDLRMHALATEAGVTGPR